MALVEELKKCADIVVDMFRDNGNEGDVFDDFEDQEEVYEDEYVTDGNAVQKPIEKPSFFPNIRRTEESKVVDFSAKRGVNDIIVIEPRSFEDVATVVQHLKDRKIVMLDLHLLDKAQSQRTIDFVCGASHALNGKPQKVGEIFVFAPSNVNLTADSIPQPNKFNDSYWGTSLQ